MCVKLVEENAPSIKWVIARSVRKHAAVALTSAVAWPEVREGIARA